MTFLLFFSFFSPSSIDYQSVNEESVVVFSPISKKFIILLVVDDDRTLSKESKVDSMKKMNKFEYMCVCVCVSKEPESELSSVCHLFFLLIVYFWFSLFAWIFVVVILFKSSFHLFDVDRICLLWLCCCRCLISFHSSMLFVLRYIHHHHHHHKKKRKNKILSIHSHIPYGTDDDDFGCM